LSESQQEPQTILITSALPREGKSTTAVNTAIVLAQTGARTMLVELDLRKPSLAATLRVNGNHGISTFLTGDSDFLSQIRKTIHPNLYFLPAGPLPPNPTELLGSERMREALEEMQSAFRFIVIDSPPLLSVTDALVLSTYADGVVLVVHGSRTSKDAVKKAHQRLSKAGGKILGAIVNNVNIRHPEYGYYYDYDYHDYYKRSDTPDDEQPDRRGRQPV
jgi:capsular exopolysaccharide synthesis family protein